jgi:4-aminobutyrate aminotransferase/(S)-3-amino-2-methylpropionate transaminase
MIDSAKLLELEKKYSAYGDPVHYTDHPPLVTRCKGSWLYDYKDTKYLDLAMWFASVNLGYAQPDVTKAVTKQMETLPQAPLITLHPTRIELAAKLAQAAEKRFGLKGRVALNVGGAQAVEDALKLVRMHTKSNGVFAFMGGFHGRTIATAALTSSYTYRSRFGHYGDRAHFVEFPYTFRAEKGISDFTEYYVSKFKRLFETEFNGVYDPKTGLSEYRAFIAEPILGTGGYIIPPRNFYKELKQVLDEYGIMFIADEIQMGFYRTGKLWSIEHFGVKPDIITMSKALTNGMNPLSCLWAREELIEPDVFTPGTAYSTFAANPLGTAAAVAVLDYFEQWENCETEIVEKGEYFLQKLQGLQDKYPKLIGNTDGLGMALHMEICEDDGWTPSKKRASFLFEEGLKGDIPYEGKKVGLVLKTGGLYRNILTLSPNLLMPKSEIDVAVTLLSKLLQRLQKVGI